MFCILKGELFQEKENLDLLKELINGKTKVQPTTRNNEYWNDTIRYLDNNDSSSAVIRKYLEQAGKTYMGVIFEGSSSASTVAFYRYQDIQKSLDELKKMDGIFKKALMKWKNNHTKGTETP